MKVIDYPFDSSYLIKKKNSIRKELLNSNNTYIHKNIAILGGSTTNEIKLQLELFLLNEGIRPVFYESEYNQYYQEAVFDNEELEKFAPDIIYIHTSNRNITAFPSLSDSKQTIDELLNAEINRFRQIWDKLEEKYRCIIIQNNFEYMFYRLLGNKDASDIHGANNFISRLNLLFYDYANEHNNFYINDINYLSAAYGLDKWSNQLYWHMYKYCCDLQAIPDLAYNIARIVKSILGKNKKGFVLDLDNTLWGGIVGDDGVDGLMLGPETPMGQVYGEFQQYIKSHKQLGVILTVDSKNERENALAGLNHPDSYLKPDEFIEIKANWEPKDRNLKEIANDLALSAEAFVFVDDNPAERAIVEAQLPGVSAPPINGPENYIRMLDKAGYFEVTSLSEDDSKRNEMYLENAKRAELQASFENYEDYLKSLEMHGVIKPFESVYMARIAQLTNKSNQFNLTTKRCTQVEIENMASDDDYICLYGRLSDKFGDNGVVSVIIGKKRDKELHMELWLMSCRVLKRNMEFAMMDAVVHSCIKQGINKIVGYYYPTQKNAMVKDFYAKQGFDKVSDNDGNTVWEFIIPENYINKNNVITVEE